MESGRRHGALERSTIAALGDLWLRDVRIAGSPAPTDIVIERGRIASVGPPPAEWRAEAIDCHAHLALPGLVDGHAHLDKTLWGQPWRPHSAGAGLPALIENEREARVELAPVVERAAALLEAYVANGTTLLRTHVDVDPENGLRAVEGVLEVAARFADRIEVEVVAFPQSGILAAPGTERLLDAALRAGASLVGGLDPAGVDGDAAAHLAIVFGLAERHGCGIDIHLHDRGPLGRGQVGLVIERTRALGLAGRVTMSHAFCLCDGEPEVEPLLEELAEQRIGLATVAPAHTSPPPLERLFELGVPVCLGQDGVRDLWSPWGDADMLSRAGQLAWRAGYRRDADIERCVEIATTQGALALGVDDLRLSPGGRGDVALVPASCRAEAAVAHPPRALVVKNGVPVAGSLRSSATRCDTRDPTSA